MYYFSNNPIKLQRAIEKAGRGASEEEVCEAYKALGGAIVPGFLREDEDMGIPDLEDIPVSRAKPAKKVAKVAKKK